MIISVAGWRTDLVVEVVQVPGQDASDAVHLLREEGPALGAGLQDEGSALGAMLHPERGRSG